MPTRSSGSSGGAGWGDTPTPSDDPAAAAGAGGAKGSPPCSSSSRTHAAGITHRPLGSFLAPGMRRFLHHRDTDLADSFGKRAATSSGDRNGLP